MDSYINKNIMITGANGVIGCALVKKFVELDANVYAVVRDIHKAQLILPASKNIKYIECDITELPLIDMKIDYLIHAAAGTASRMFVNSPVDIIYTNVWGTRRALEFARINNVKCFVYLSTMEIYGSPQTDDKIDETYISNVNTMEARACYPESKRMCENLCKSYFTQYSVPIRVLRLTQTFGVGVKYDDTRIFAEFARCVIEEKNIVLHTKGETRRSYLYVEDCIDGILCIMQYGVNGEAYNVANEATYCSIYDMAKMVAKECANNRIKVVIEENNEGQYGYAPVLKMNLDTSKIRSLGWKPTVGLKGMYKMMIDDMKKSKK